jgi:hypothetical protein
MPIVPESLTTGMTGEAGRRLLGRKREKNEVGAMTGQR